MLKEKILKNKKGGSELIAFLIVIGVTALLVGVTYPQITGALGGSIDGISRSYNSTDTIVLD